MGDTTAAAMISEDTARKCKDALSKLDTARAKLRAVDDFLGDAFPATASVAAYLSVAFAVPAGVMRGHVEREVAEAEAAARALGIRLVGDAGEVAPPAPPVPPLPVAGLEEGLEVVGV